MTTSSCTCHAERHATPRGGSSRTTRSTELGTGQAPHVRRRQQEGYPPPSDHTGRKDILSGSRTVQASVEEPVQHAHPEAKAVYRHPLVDTVEHAGKIQFRRQLSGLNPKQRTPSLAEPLRVGSRRTSSRAPPWPPDLPRSRAADIASHRSPSAVVSSAMSWWMNSRLDRGAEHPVDLGEELFFAAGQEAPVNFGGRRLRDDVDLVARLEPGRVCGVLRGRRRSSCSSRRACRRCWPGPAGRIRRRAPALACCQERRGRVRELGRPLVPARPWRPPPPASVTALSPWIIDPCPAVPVAVSRIQASPFSAVCTA